MIVADHIVDYIINNPCLTTRGITKEHLTSLCQSGKIVFLLNGWNEIGSSYIQKATRFLTRLDREFTSSGIIITTRENSIKPPFFNSIELELKELDNNQRKRLTKHLIPEKWELFLDQIEVSQSLSQITRIPLILTELITACQDDIVLPPTKAGVFELVINRIEHSSEHSAALQSEPISGKAGYYLTQLSSYATHSGQISLKHHDTCRVISEGNDQLQQLGQLQIKPEPTNIINALCGHHLLIRSNYPDVTIRFVHQQFQEYFAFLYIKKQLQKIVNSPNKQDVCQFQQEIINYPIWEEPLKLLAEEIAHKLETSSDEYVLKSGEYLVRWTIPIDPVFAAKLVNILGNTIWNIVKSDFESILRKWYEYPDENHKACALAAMFTTGTDSFSDIIWPLLEHKDNQIRLKAYRTAKPFMVSCLGDNWQNRINAWGEDRRAEFLSELSFNCTVDATSIFEYYAQNDPSPKVKVAAINAVGWYGPRSNYYELLSGCDDKTFEIIIRHDYILNKFPVHLVPKALDCYMKLLKEQDNTSKRLRLLLNMYRLNKTNAISLMKKELEGFQPERRDFLINDLLKKIASEDPDWVSWWVCQKVAHGNLYYDYYSDYINTIPESLIGKLLKDFVKPDYSKQLEFETKKLIAAGATKEHIRIILKEIAKLLSVFKESANSILEPERNLYHRLLGVARLVPLQNLATVILQDYEDPKSNELGLILDLFGCYRIQIQRENPFILQEETQKHLRQLFLKYLNLIIKENDYSGKLKADLSCAIALFGQPEDIAVIKELVARDIERVRNGRKARKEGRRNNPQVNGCSTSWAGWHIRAILKVYSDEIEDFLIQLLNEPEYENDAADGLVQLLWKDIPAEKLGIRTHTTLAIGSHTWREEYIDPAKRDKYAQAIAQRIQDKKKNHNGSNYGLKGLAEHLAKLNAPETTSLILEILQVPGKYDAWCRFQTLETLVRNGHCLETAIVENIINPAIEQAVDIRISGKQDMYLLTQCLCILACSNDIAKAISIIDQILAKYKLWYELRGLIETLGYRKNSDATSYLILMCQQKQVYNALCYELVEALGKTEVPEAKQALFSTIDNSITSHKIPMPNHNGRSSLSQALANIYQSDKIVQKRIISLCNEKGLSKEQKSIIISIINSSPSNRAIIAAISMLSQDNDNIPYELENAVEKSVVQHIPIDNMAYGYNLQLRINNELSEFLFKLAIDDQKEKLLSFKLLGYINWLRLEHGRPALEHRHPDIQSHIEWPIEVDPSQK